MAEYDFNHPNWIQKSQRTFRMFDRNRDGKVDYNEFTKVLRDIEGACKPSKEEMIIAYEIVDDITKEIGIGSNDPGISMEEWVARLQRFGAEEIARGKCGEPLKFKRFHSALFNIVDTNKDGHLSLEELTVMCKIHVDATDAQCKNAFDTLDKNHNGEISRKEYVDTYFELFFSINNINLYGNNFIDS